MNAYQFNPLPSLSSVAGLVTVLVSGWFAIASGALLTEPVHGIQAANAAKYNPRVIVSEVREVRNTVLVVAKRPSQRPTAVTL